jgi:ATP-dependent Zn protease
MVRHWRFSPRLGLIGFGSGEPAHLGQGQLESRLYAEGTQHLTDEEVSRILTEAGERTGALLTERRDSLDAAIDLLLE